MHANEQEYIKKLERSIRRAFNYLDVISSSLLNENDRKGLYNLGILRESLLNAMDYIEENNPSENEDDEESED